MPAPTISADQLIDGILERLYGEKQARASGDLTGYKHDASGTPRTTGYAHGPGGLLTYPGVDQDVHQTIIGALPGILNEIPTRGSPFTNPLYEVVTGFLAESGTAPTEACDDAEQAGLMKAGIITAPFGKYRFGTQEIDITRLGQRIDRGDPMDLRLMGNPLFRGLRTTGTPNVGTQALTNEMTKLFLERAMFAHRRLSVQAWQGLPAAAQGAFPQMVGLTNLVTTGHVDAINNTALPSLDSDVKDMNYTCVDDDSDAVINALTYLMRFLRNNARRMGVDPVRFVLAMREELFYELTAVWPCSYLTYRCILSNAAGERVNIDAGDAVAMRDRMRTGQYLIIDGVQYDVLLDDGIPEQTDADSAQLNAGQFASSIFVLPMSVLGGVSTLYLDYFEFQDNQSIRDALGRMTIADVLDGGMWIEWPRQTNNCVVWDCEINPRIVLRTPWLAGRLNNVCYEPLQHTRQPFPDDPYFTDGGNTTRPGPSLYAAWKS